VASSCSPDDDLADPTLREQSAPATTSSSKPATSAA
jgi:hypothetical protein